MGFFEDEYWSGVERFKIESLYYEGLIRQFELDPRFSYLGRGRHRAGYLHKTDWVIKVPISSWGIRDNEREAHQYREKAASFPIARCRLAFNSPILVMEYLLSFNKTGVYSNYTELPQWARDIDCFQVGFTRRGELVAYDYASNS